MRTQTTAATLATLVAAGLTGVAEGLNVWTKVSGKVVPTNERFAAVPFTPVAVNHGALVAELEKDSPTLEFALVGNTITCTVTNSGVMHPGLAAKFPTIKSLSGSCTDGSDVSLNIDTATVGSMDATFYTPSGRMYADPIANGVYMVYSHDDARAKGVTPDGEFKCEVDESTARKLSNKLRGKDQRRQAQSAALGYKFRIAMLASREFGVFHGATNETIMLAIVNTMVRVNGVYIRELGVFFELIEDNDKLICLPDDATCDDWPNDTTLINLNEGLMQERGVTPDMYDIGHSVSTNSGGIAGFPAFCTGSKARGTTGISQPIGDPFWIDYVAHEIGHQLRGAHTFRDCSGESDTNLSPIGAVEPGGGVTIMGYAGICGSNNVQSNSDPHFNSINLEAMRDLIESRVAGGCGETFTTSGDRPVVTTEAGRCVVPKGNYVQLSGTVENLDPSTMSFAWDRVDLGYEEYSNVDVPRFRPWGPGPSQSRFLPNMYFLTYGLGDQLGELPPKASVPGDKEMTFRFVGRTQYDRNAEQSSFDINSIGAFDFKDVTVWYQSNEEPLTITNQITELVVGSTMDITWVGGTLAGNVEIMLAVNTMTEVSDFRYENDVKDLDWVSVAVVRNTGSATVTIPQLTASLDQEVNLMVRSTGNEDCYFFDLLPRLAFVGGTSGTASPTVPTVPIPTAAPVTFSPTTGSPTTTPTPAPTAPDGWLCNPAYYGASDGCDCACGVRDIDCDKPYTALYCTEVPFDLGEYYCDVDTNTCVSEETEEPTEPPTSPDANVTDSPTLATPTAYLTTPPPTAYPTAYPTTANSTGYPTNGTATAYPTTAYPTNDTATPTPSAKEIAFPLIFSIGILLVVFQACLCIMRKRKSTGVDLTDNGRLASGNPAYTKA